MSEPVDPGAPAPAPAPASQPAQTKTSAQQILETIGAGLKEVIPAGALAITLPMLVTHALPASSEKLALAIAAAIAGFMTGRASKGSAE